MQMRPALEGVAAVDRGALGIGMNRRRGVTGHMVGQRLVGMNGQSVANRIFSGPATAERTGDLGDRVVGAQMRERIAQFRALVSPRCWPQSMRMHSPVMVVAPSTRNRAATATSRGQMPR